MKSLSPAVEQLTAAGSNLTKALKIAGTFPFPLGNTLEAVRGDYANLHLFLDLNLSDQLCGLNKALCTGLPGENKASNSQQPLPQSNSATRTGPPWRGRVMRR